MKFRSMHFRVIKCDFGNIAKVEVGKIKLKDFKILYERLQEYMAKSEGNFHDFCSPVIKMFEYGMDDVLSSHDEDGLIINLDFESMKVLKKLAEKIVDCSSEYITAETNGIGMLKIKHLVSSQRVAQVRKLKGICSKILKVQVSCSKENEYKETLEEETKTIRKLSEEIRAAGKAQEGQFGTLEGTLLSTQAIKSFEKCVKESFKSIVSKNKDNDFYLVVLFIQEKLKDFKPQIEEIIKSTGKSEKPEETLAKGFEASCNKILGKINNYLNKSNEESGEFKELSKARVDFMRNIQEIVEATKGYLEWWE